MVVCVLTTHTTPPFPEKQAFFKIPCFLIDFNGSPLFGPI